MQTKTTPFVQEGKFRYTENGEGEALLLLHGLFGGLSNFEPLVGHFSNIVKVALPVLPIFDLPRKQATIDNLLTHIKEFVEYKGYEKVHLLGNSLGGHIALLYTLDCPEKVKTLTLTGSSGLYESAFGSGFPRRGSYEYIKERTEKTFYDPKVATKELVDEVFDTVNNIDKAMAVITAAKSAIRHNVKDRLAEITTPTLLIWGKHDIVTPYHVGESFHELIKDSEFHGFEKSGHAPMMECPEEFNAVLEQFLNKHIQ